jgi:hypothetical protein
MDVPRSIGQCIAPRRALVCVGSLTVEHSRGTHGVLTPHTHRVLCGVLRGNHGQRTRGLPSRRLCTDCACALRPVLGYSRVLEGTPWRWRAVGGCGVLVGYSRVLPRYRSGTRVRGCGGTADGPMHAVLSCAGAYVSGAAGSNACPAGSVRIETEAACRTAAAAAGKPAGSSSFPFVRTDSNRPRGCYYSSNNAYFNTHAVGAGWSGFQLLCAALTTGAPLKRRRRADARSARTGARACRHHACAMRHSRAVCVIHGRHIDAHTYMNRYLYTLIYTRMLPTALVGGAARRTAAQADGGRACTGT